MIKNTIFLFLTLLIFGCVNSRINKCNKILQQSESSLGNYYDIQKRTMDSSSIILRWNKLIVFLCDKIDLGDKFLIMEKTGSFSGGQEGLINVIGDNKYYYFKRDGKHIEIKEQSSELKNLKQLIIYLLHDVDKFSKELYSKTQNMIIYDSANLDFLLIDLTNKEESIFFSLKYSSVLFEGIE